MKTLAIVQARSNSVRFPNKVMKKINHVPMIGILIKRLMESKEINEIILATSLNKSNDDLVSYISNEGISCFRGDENDVLQRYYEAARINNGDIIVRITGDCPLIDARLVDECIKEFKDKNFDYFTNTLPPSFPDGLDVEVFSFKALEEAHNKATHNSDREHVTKYIRDSNDFTKGNISYDKDLSAIRWTVDEKDDFEVIKKIFNHFSPDIKFNWIETLDFYNKNKEVFKINSNIKRNEGGTMSKSQKLWKRAKKIIPGGNMLLSKRPDMFLPGAWPTYFSKTKKCEVWDLDDNKYIDMSIMGVGTNILGYNNEEVDEAVINTINKGNMSTLNCFEEVMLAEELISMHPWSDMARFARSGGEANAIAIRIARAASGKDNVAVCGYHGWHDWYLSANISDKKNLDKHLLPGLNTYGVPKNLKGTVFPFIYNDFNALEELVRTKDIGTIKMEVMRNKGPDEGYLQKIRKLASEKNIILIFDECTSGFRQNYGGLHKNYNVEPDMAMFGKALGNGYAITAVIGKEEIMQSAQSTFISSTFWTERIGPTAALKSLEVMKKIKSWDKITKTGNLITSEWQKISEKYSLDIDFWGMPALTGFSFSSKDHIKYKTYITQEMLKKGYLASNCVYVCTEHSDKIVKDYIECLDPILKIIKECEEGRSIDSLLEGPHCNTGFGRLN